MRTRIINPEFPDIYKLHLLSGSTVSSILVKAGTSNISDPDFIETDYKYSQGKLEFSSPGILNELVGNDKTVIEGNVEKYLLTLFPTNTLSSSSPDNISYFSSSVSSEGEETLVVLIPEEISGVMMYDSKGWDAVEVTFEGDEIGFSKVLTVVTSYDPSSPTTINLAWTAFEGDKNPVKKMSECVLRNDAFVKEWKGYHEKNNFLYSNISNSLLGTEKLEDRPLYNFLKGFSGNWWNKRKRYSIGDKVVVGDTEFESLEANNIGNHPYYSRMWIKTIV